MFNTSRSLSNQSFDSKNAPSSKKTFAEQLSSSGEFLYVPEHIEYHMKHYHIERIPDYIASIIIDEIKKMIPLNPSYKYINEVKKTDFIPKRDLNNIELITRRAIQNELRKFAVKQQQSYEALLIITSIAAIKAIFYLHNYLDPSQYNLPEDQYDKWSFNFELDLQSDKHLVEYAFFNDITLCINQQFKNKLNLNSPEIIARELVKIWDFHSTFHSSPKDIRRMSQWITKYYDCGKETKDRSNGFFNAIIDQWSMLFPSFNEKMTKKILLEKFIIPTLQDAIDRSTIVYLRQQCAVGRYFKIEFFAGDFIVKAVMNALDCNYNLVMERWGRSFIRQSRHRTVRLAYDEAHFRMFNYHPRNKTIPDANKTLPNISKWTILYDAFVQAETKEEKDNANEKLKKFESDHPNVKLPCTDSVTPLTELDKKPHAEFEEKKKTANISPSTSLAELGKFSSSVSESAGAGIRNYQDTLVTSIKRRLNNVAFFATPLSEEKDPQIFLLGGPNPC